MDFLNYCRRLSGDDGLNNTLGTTGGEGINMVSKYNDLDEPVFDREEIVHVPIHNRPKILEDWAPPKVRKNLRYHKPRVTRQQSSGPLSAWLQIEKES